jgi:hypothetical protein
MFGLFSVCAEVAVKMEATYTKVEKHPLVVEGQDLNFLLRSREC